MRFRTGLCFGMFLILLSGCLTGKTPFLYEGEVPDQPVNQVVTVVRDAQGVPHIYAEDPEDLFFALGYTMAQDRLFQMDLYRHVALGRLCEWFGNVRLGDGMRLVQMDMLLKSFELGKHTGDALPGMSPEDRALLERFVLGINRFIQDSGDKPPVEYRFLRVRPEAWTASDVMTIPELFGVGLGMIAMGTEVLHTVMEHTVGEQLTRDFFQRYTGMPVPAPQTAASAPGPAAGGFRNLMLAGGLMRQGVPQGSNNWVVSGNRSRNGMPILANDPHVPLGLAPSFWYHAHLQGGGFSVEGLLYPGFPCFGAAWNGTTAWGVTNIMADQTDLYLERLDPEDPDRYETADGWKRFDSRDVTCKVRMGRDRTFALKKGVHGFLVPREALENDISRKFPWFLDPVSLRYVTTDPAAYWKGQLLLMKAGSSEQVKEALQMIGQGPTAYNYVWACRDGDIGYHAAGRIPIREDGQGFAMKQGWKPGVSWRGCIPFDKLPARENPEDGMLLTANEKIVPPDYPWYISVDYAAPYRARRIRQLLLEKDLCSPERFRNIQADVYNLAAPPILDALREAFAAEGKREALTDPERRALEALLAWDLETSADSGDAALFEIFFQHLLEETFADEMGEDLTGPALATNFMAAKVLDSLLQDPDNPWFDRGDTEGAEGRDRIFRQAFRKAVKICRQEMGRDPDGWSWGKVHTLYLGHPFGLIPLIGKSFRIADLPYAGDNDTVNGGYFIFDDEQYKVVAGAASRFVVDLARPSGAWFNCSTGMAGEPSSAYFKNLTPGWYYNRYFWTPLAGTPGEIPSGKRLRLEP